MNRYFIWTILFVCVFGCKTQPQLNRDLLVTEICNSFKSDTTVASDSAKASRILKSHLEPLAQNIPRDSAEDLYMFVYARLYKECDEFVALCDRLLRTLDSSDWKSVDIEPESQISESDADQFFQIGNFKYIGTNGDSVNLDVTDSTWQDRFIDGTYSNLSLKKLSKREFVIAFIESNNQHRKYYNKAGDQYRYRILERSGNRYLMLTQSFGSKFKYTFNLYY